jgi:tetratricopeptide (TPR) repeat protein
VPAKRRSFYRAWYLRICGHFGEAQREQEKFELAGPTSIDDWFGVASSRWVRRQFRAGIVEARRALDRYPDNYDLHWIQVRCLVAEGEYHEAIQAIEKAQRIWDGQEMTSLLACAYVGLGELAVARNVLKELLGLQRKTYVQPYFVARVYAALGEKETALDWLEKAAKDRSEFLFLPDLGGLRTDPAWDSLRHERRYREICEDVGLGEEDWPRKKVLP